MTEASYEECFLCGDLTERAGAGEDSIYCDECDTGPYCPKCFRIHHEGNELQKNVAFLLLHGSFMDYKGSCEQYLHCRLCGKMWLWENDEPSEHKKDCLYLLKKTHGS